MNSGPFPVDLLSAALQQQPPHPHQQQQTSPAHNQGPSAFQYRSSSVIVHPNNVSGGFAENHQLMGEGVLAPPPKKRGSASGKRPNRDDGDFSVGPGGKMAKLEMGVPRKQRALSPEALGVNRFISPFSPEAKIPLPHELNELSAHGTTVWKRNERERQRVRCVNEGYAQLRSQLPLTEHDRRLSKVDTLRLAIAYIGHLEQLLAVGRAHQLECQCFNNYTSSGEEGGSAENTPPPPN